MVIICGIVVGNIELNSNGSMEGGSGLYTWSIATDGKATFNHITANTGGSIGGWTIGSTYLKGGKVTLKNSGELSGTSWSISAEGYAHFEKIYGQVRNEYTFVGGGTTITGGLTGAGGCTNLTAGTTSVDSKSLNQHIKDLVVERLNITDGLKFRGK